MRRPNHSHRAIWIFLSLTTVALLLAVVASFTATPGMNRLFTFERRVEADCASLREDASPGTDRQQTREACEAIRKQLEAEKAEFRAAGYR